MQPIRQRITEILKEGGPTTVADLADRLGLAQVSVRHHLDILIGEDLVAGAGVRRHDGAGRPSQVYALTESALRLFPQRHEALATGMLNEMKAALPPATVREMFMRLAERTASDAPSVTPDQSVEERLQQITGFLTEKGYNAHWETCGDHYELHACNCPYLGVADEHPELCMMDQAMLQNLLPGVIRLESRALDGASHCRYLIGESITRPLAATKPQSLRGA